MKTKNLVIVIIAVIILIIGIYVYSTHSTNDSEKVTLKVGYLPLTDHLPIMVADARHMFADTNIELVKFTDWAALSEALASGQIDGAHILNTLGIKMVTNGFKGQTVVLSHRGDIALVTKEEITEVQQLRGKTIAVPSHFSSHYFMLYHYLTENGFNVSTDIRLLDVAPPDFVSTMAAGGIDGFIGSEPFPELAISKNIGKIFKNWDEMEIEGLNGLDCVVVFNQQMIDQHPEAVQDYVTTIIQAGQWIEDNPKEAANITSPYMMNIAPALLEDAKAISTYDNLYPKADEYSKLQDYMLSIGAIKSSINMTAFVNTKFADKAYKDLGLTIN